MKIERLSISKEHDLMLPESNMGNIKKIISLSDKFFLSSDSVRRLEKYLSGNLSETEAYLDNVFKLNNQKRAFFELNITENEDFAYSFYKKTLQNQFYCNNYDLDVEFKEKLLEYSTFRAGKIKIKSQVRKLFKYLLSKEILSQDYVDHINTIRTKKDNILLCISRNPIDYLMIATNQGFTSCVDFDSRGIACFFLSNIGSIIDPNRFLIFLTDGYIKKYEFKSETIKHFKYLSRSWGLVFNDDYLLLIKIYPTSILDLKSALSIIQPNNKVFNLGEDCNKFTEDEYKKLSSKFKFEPLKFLLKNRYAIPYIDNIIATMDKKTNEVEYQLSSDHDMNKKYINRVDTRFKSEAKFNEMDSICDAITVYKCDVCDEDIHYNDIINEDDNSQICKYCYSIKHKRGYQASLVVDFGVEEIVRNENE